jgi:hypothetical protein
MDMKIRMATLAVLVMLAATIATAAPVEERLTQGKLAADLGDHAAAEKAFASVSTDNAASAPSRAEALVRLGIIQRTQGKTQASADAFQKAMASPGRDAAVTRLLALAVAGVAPERARWERDWSKVSLAVRGGAPAIVWPGPAPKGVRELFPSDPVTFDLHDVSLAGFLSSFLGHQRSERIREGLPGFENWPPSYKVPVALQEGKMDYIIHADVQGHRPDCWDARATHISVKATNMPWNELFENVLASHGLGFVLEDNLLLIAPLEKLGALDRVRGRAYPGRIIALAFLNHHAYPAITPRGKTMEEYRRSAQDRTLQVHDPGAFAQGSFFEEIWGFRFVVDSDLQGAFNYRLMHRPSMEILDLMLASTDAAAVRLPDENGKPVLRIATVAAAGAQALDLSKVQPAASPR